MIYVESNVVQLMARAAVLLLLVAVGCDNDDERLVELAREADARQAEQNREIAQQNHELAEATNKLIQADAEARKELVALEREVQTERAEVGRQRDQLEVERRENAKDRRWDSAASEAVHGGAILLACLLPLLLCAYMLHALRHTDPNEAIGEILTAEIVSDDPVFLPPPDFHTGALQDRRAQTDGPDSSIE